MKLCTCFRPGLEICIWVGYNPWIKFCHFFHFVNFVIFRPQILWKCIDSGYLVSATPYTISCLSLCNFAFFHGLKMCMWFGFNPAVNFCHFSTSLTLSFFAGETSTSPKFDLYYFFVIVIFNVHVSHLMPKPTKWYVRQAKTQISLGIRTVWLESLLCAQYVVKGPVFLHSDSEDSGPGWSESSLGAHAILLVLS